MWPRTGPDAEGAVARSGLDALPGCWLPASPPLAPSGLSKFRDPQSGIWGHGLASLKSSLNTVLPLGREGSMRPAPGGPSNLPAASRVPAVCPGRAGVSAAEPRGVLPVSFQLCPVALGSCELAICPVCGAFAGRGCSAWAGCPDHLPGDYLGHLSFLKETKPFRI